MMHKTLIIPILISVFLTSCGDDDRFDAYGNFEATTVTVSAKGNGELLKFDIEEGEDIALSENVGLIDTLQLYLEKQKLYAQISSLGQKLQESAPEVAVLLEEQSNLIRERDRTQRLVAQMAATQQQLDDYNGKVDKIAQQINSTKRQVGIANRGILAEREPLLAQIALINKQISDNTILNPLKGTVLVKFAEPGELVNSGTPLYKIADLEKIKLHAYTSATLLQNVTLGDTVNVLIDHGQDDYRKLKGTISFIASEAEFTPKTIQTKEERVNLVYAIEVVVENDGTLKIGMPGEVVFDKIDEE